MINDELISIRQLCHCVALTEWTCMNTDDTAGPLRVSSMRYRGHHGVEGATLSDRKRLISSVSRRSTL